ncbi:hypothetical protein Pogu_1053 [Pyrobaculum oguniense TE7]|uniref:4Fe-4S ferredoxin-type domain-containing protein n=1 Tax=Pyrobaculum oguniense (strain DSM 13380 / JCM 10595 / TE7) TaxID=698757 RepID=H6Q8J8_PYROT|nr:hypothetical protein Pogu_1053 [Pyrobaculum oguniense TE7]
MIFYTDLCLRAYGAYCDRCAAVCPREALYFTDRGVELSPFRCTECGACQRVCPNEALVVKPLTAINDSKCEGLGGSIPCAAYLDGKVANALGLKYVEICERCPKGVDADAEAKRLAQDGLIVERRPAVVDAARRRLLKGPPEFATLSGRGSPPIRHKLAGGMGCIEIKACIFCGVCAGVCPTGALLETDGVIEFNPANCTECGLCAALCKYGEIKVGRGECKPFVVKAERRCIECGRPYIGHGEVCPRCRDLNREFSLFLNSWE